MAKGDKYRYSMVQIVTPEHTRTKRSKNFTFKKVLVLTDGSVAMKFIDRHGAVHWYNYSGDVDAVNRMGVGRNSAGKTLWNQFRRNPEVYTSYAGNSATTQDWEQEHKVERAIHKKYSDNRYTGGKDKKKYIQ